MRGIYITFLVIGILLLIIIPITVVMLLRKRYTPSLDEYLNMIYPDAKKLPNISDLNFFYECIPKEVIQKFGPIYSTLYVPAPYNRLWTPVWFPSGAVAVNKYDPTSWWTYQTQAKSGWVEVMHVPDDIPKYKVYGYWVYQTTGSGVMINLGNTLACANKIEALFKLMGSIDAVAKFIQDKNYQTRNNITRAVKDLAQDYFAQSKTPVHDLVSKVLTNNNVYDIDRLNNSADWDPVITTKANQAKYDSVQFIIQANGNGGWAHEIVFTGMPLKYLLKSQEKTWPGWSWILNRIKSSAGSCSFNPTENYAMVICEQQPIHYVDKCNSM